MCKNLALKSLILTTNKNYGHTPKTPTDFNRLSLSIQKKTGSSISQSSLKRIWGYVNYTNFPSPTTLNILSQFNGFEDWEDFLKRYDKTQPSESSEYLNGSVVDAESLKEGDMLKIAWEDDKCCDLIYLSDHRFRITASQNIKLTEGDTFTMHSACVGLPFFAADIHRGEERIPGYVGAKNNGITSILLHHKDPQ